MNKKMPVLKATELQTLSDVDLVEEFEACLLEGTKTQLDKYWRYANMIKRQIIIRMKDGVEK